MQWTRLHSIGLEWVDMSVLLRLEAMYTLISITGELKFSVEICARRGNTHIISNLCKPDSMNSAQQFPRIRASHSSPSALRINDIFSPLLTFWYVDALMQLRFRIRITLENKFPCRGCFVKISSNWGGMIELSTEKCINLGQASKYVTTRSTTITMLVPNLVQCPVEKKMAISRCVRLQNGIQSFG